MTASPATKPRCATPRARSALCTRSTLSALCVLCALCGLAAALPPAAGAQAYPVRPIRLIIPFPAGGPRDVQARLLGPRLTEVWGQPVVIDNRAGANGIIGTELAAHSPPDGYTLLMISAGFATATNLYGKLPYDPFRDFAVVAPLTRGPGILIVHNALPVKSVSEFVAYARARPGQLNYGSAGNGTPSHLAVELLSSMTGTRYTHVPYKGMAPALTDLLGGQLQFSLPTIPGGLPLAQNGRVRALGVSGARRSPAAPEIPSLAESGLPGYEATNWYGLAAPAATPGAIIAKLNGEVARVLRMPDITARLLAIGMEVEMATPAAFTAFLKVDAAKWAKVIQAAGLRPDTPAP